MDMLMMNKIANDPMEINFKLGPITIYFCFFLGLNFFLGEIKLLKSI